MASPAHYVVIDLEATFGNQLGELVLHDRQASFRLFVIDRDDAGGERLQLVAELPLSDPVAAEVTG